MGKPYSPKVLYVDDDPIQMDLCSVLLKSGGFTFVPLNPRVSAIEASVESGIDLILLDAQQHRLEDLVQLARALRRKFPDAPILLLADDWAPDPNPVQEAVPNVWRCDVSRLVATVSDRIALKSRKLN